MPFPEGGAQNCSSPPWQPGEVALGVPTVVVVPRSVTPLVTAVGFPVDTRW
jgi:hypothetical protein